jgi:hypothetical protein
VVEDMSVAPTAVVESKFVVLLTVDYIAVLLKPGYIVVLKLVVVVVLTSSGSEAVV